MVGLTCSVASVVWGVRWWVAWGSVVTPCRYGVGCCGVEMDGHGWFVIVRRARVCCLVSCHAVVEVDQSRCSPISL